MSDLPALPVIVPLATAALTFAAWKRTGIQKVIGVIGAVALLRRRRRR